MKRKLKTLVIAILCGVLVSSPFQQAEATPIAILQIIKAAVKKVIVAVDLKIQRLQNKTIWLQNAQKTLENTLSKLKLDEISDWTEKQKKQYKEYFEELHKVKMLISYHQRIREITQKQIAIVQEYQRVWQLLQQDDHFTIKEIQYMGHVYTGIIGETVKNIDQLALVINSFKVQMSDAKRLLIINEVAEKVDVNYTDLRSFNQENSLLSIQRSKGDQETEFLKKLYDIK